MNIEFTLPDLGENVEAGDVVSVLVKEGEVIQAEQNVLEIETEKAVVEIPCPHPGKVAKVHVKSGDRVAVGALLLTLDAASPSRVGVVKAPTPASAPVVAAAPAAPPAPPPQAKKQDPPAAARPRKAEPVHATRRGSEHRPEMPVSAAGGPRRLPAPAGPATRRLSRQLGVDLDRVHGSGTRGRITVDDVKAHVRQLMGSGAAGAPAADGAPPPLPDFSQWGAVEMQPLSGLRRKIAENMSLAWRVVPHVTQFDEADVTELELGRRRIEKESEAKGEPRVTVTVLAMKACVAALKEFPQFNASLDIAAGRLVLKRYYHIGVAVDTPQGLLVPVLRDVDRKSLRELAAELADLAARARERKVSVEELRGGSFTVTNLGGIGGIGFTPIVNYPEVAILGIARLREVVALRDGAPAIRSVLPLSLSYDHRVIDGADGARFLRRVATLLGDSFRLLLEV
jgi:pyruvate dehydrogenase E2 component (dihydrolipoamide acetyltransferase)